MDYLDNLVLAMTILYCACALVLHYFVLCCLLVAYVGNNFQFIYLQYIMLFIMFIMKRFDVFFKIKYQVYEISRASPNSYT